MRPCGVSTFGKSFRISWFPGAESFHERPLAVQSIWGVRFEFDAYDLHRHRVMASIVIPKSRLLEPDGKLFVEWLFQVNHVVGFREKTLAGVWSC